MSPRVSIITSIHKGEKYISHFLNDITKQTIFNDCELILVNAASPENEKAYIDPFLERHDNIKYFELNADPGIYAVWNLAIESSTAKYITNANLDDSKAPWCIEEQAFTLDNSPDVDLVYGETLETKAPLETFLQNTADRIFSCPEFSLENLLKINIPHASPMWRRSIHEKYGHFNPEFKYCGDYDMWVRAARQNSLFKKINSHLVLYYRNPEGLSTKKENIKEATEEFKKIKS
jgi:glycosyltransferase involved in cell wall biosynthesis